jgi:hypothetical protein
LDFCSSVLFGERATQAAPEAVSILKTFDAVLSFLGGAEEPVTRRLEEICPGRIAAVDPRPMPAALRGGVHITRQWIQALNNSHRLIPAFDSITLDLGNRSHPGFTGNTALLRARLRLQRGPIALCHPGSGSLRKNCPLEALEKLVRQLSDHGWQPAWMIGPDEWERFGDGYAQRLLATAPVLYEPSVEIAADLVCAADLFIGNDAGMTHVSALADVPTLAIFGPTDPRVWRPLGRQVYVVSFPSKECPLIAWVDQCLTMMSGENNVPRGSSAGLGQRPSLGHEPKSGMPMVSKL